MRPRCGACTRTSAYCCCSCAVAFANVAESGCGIGFGRGRGEGLLGSGGRAGSGRSGSGRRGGGLGGAGERGSGASASESEPAASGGSLATRGKRRLRRTGVAAGSALGGASVGERLSMPQTPLLLLEDGGGSTEGGGKGAPLARWYPGSRATALWCGYQNLN